MRFATRMLVVQVAAQVAVVGVAAGVFLALGVSQLREEAESSALNIARTVAEDPDVRRLVTAYSADPGTPQAAELRDGELQEFALAVGDRTDGLFVVITDDHGIRLAHPTPSRLGMPVSTSFAEALAGEEVVTWEHGTLGVSARAKVPVYPPDGATPVGEVSVGFEPASVFDDLPALLLGIGGTVAVAVAVGIGVSLLMRRRLESVTLGVQPEELAALVGMQTAVLEGSGDGVIALDPDGVVRLCTPTAERLLGITGSPLGLPLSEVALSPAVQHALRTPGATDGVVVDARVLYVDVRPVRRGARALGTVAVVRDRTDLLALTERLGSVRTLSDALRVQRHEFANRLHAAAGLIDAGRSDEARQFLWELVERGPLDYAVPGLAAVGDPLLQSFIGAKATAARERDVALVVDEQTMLRGRVGDVEDVAAVLGNIIDNAVDAAASAPPPRRVELMLLDDGTTLVATVADTGTGVTDPARLFERRSPDPGAPDDRVRNLGIGLPLSRELARRRDGDVWLIDAGGAGTGAVFGARLPGVMDAVGDEEERT